MKWFLHNIRTKKRPDGGYKWYVLDTDLSVIDMQDDDDVSESRHDAIKKAKEYIETELLKIDQ